MDSTDKMIVAAAIGCLIALAIWKATKERWVPSLFGILGVAATLKLASKFDFPIDILIFGGGLAVLAFIKFLFLDLLEPRWVERKSKMKPGDYS
jgi:hypothetical protein